MKKWLKIHITVLIAILLAHLSVALLVQREVNHRKITDYHIRVEIAKYRTQEVPVIDLTECTDFKWDRLFIFGPYTTARTINKNINTFWLGAYFSRIDSDESITLLIFMNKGRVVQYVEFSRDKVDFSTVANEAGYSSYEAKFTLDERGRVVWHGNGE
jgi:hypothetical protein